MISYVISHHHHRHHFVFFHQNSCLSASSLAPAACTHNIAQLSELFKFYNTARCRGNNWGGDKKLHFSIKRDVDIPNFNLAPNFLNMTGRRRLQNMQLLLEVVMYKMAKMAKKEYRYTE